MTNITRTLLPGHRLVIRRGTGKLITDPRVELGPDDVLTIDAGTPPPDPARPFPAPVTTRTVTAPTTDPTAFLKTVPDGSIVDFPATTYSVVSILLEGRKNLVLRGNGTKLRLTGPGLNSGAQEAAFLLRNCQNIQITGTWDVTGGNQNNPNVFAPGHENQHVLALSGWYNSPPCERIEMTGVTANEILTDLAYIEGQNGDARAPSKEVWVHHNKGRVIGRMPLAAINTLDVIFEDNDVDIIGGAAFDIEPNFVQEQVRRVQFRNNLIGRYGIGKEHPAFFVTDVATGSGLGSSVSDIFITGNKTPGTIAGYDGKPRGLHSKFISTGGNRHRNIVFSGNECTMPVSGGPSGDGVLYFNSVDGVTVRGNVQPLTSGSLLATPGCTGVQT